MRVIFAKFLLYSKIQTLLTNYRSDKLLTTTIVIGMPTNLYAGTFKLILSSSSWSKTNCYHLSTTMQTMLMMQMTTTR